MIKKNELKQLTKNQVDERLTELNKELMKFNSQRAIGTTLESPGKIRQTKRTIAKLLTIKNQQKNTKEVKNK